ncbi:DUF1516 family protein [Alkalihalobacillus hemicellulosilyticus]|uniref:UPF0344 protein JCM9152_2620 n=1 Tax=Halalkalibacter hemicellulosilyticusJCM 9152 TaxID=1236971 RepID=W4QGF7_9BACI|nr:DUF1516 family protein [Halalkalibacter hemicellulosilyticus]GAE31171.1 uncharacterized protein UPF0344 [Halalkalibacter hemicellulosilyticusJCM 9152]
MSQTLINIFYESHRGSWTILIILFIVAFFLYKAQKNKGATVVHMITRLFYLIMLVSGIGTLIGYQFPVVLIVKGILALVLIYVMEMILVRTKKNTLGDKAGVYWIALVVISLIVILMGFGVIRF